MIKFNKCNIFAKTMIIKIFIGIFKKKQPQMTTYANQNFFRVSFIHLFFGMLVLITPSSDLLFIRQIPQILG